MNYKEFQPAELLRPFIKCYYIFEPAGDGLFEDKAFATGCLEIMFNLGEGTWQIDNGNGFNTNPSVELWGQIIQPLTFRSIGKNFMLGARFFPHTAAALLNDDISQFNNKITDLTDVSGKTVKEIYSKLRETNSLQERLKLLDAFFLQRLSSFETKLKKTALIHHAMNEMKKPAFFDNIENLASRYGISSRYLQKIFVQQTGLSPKLFSKINRFQNSLQLLVKEELSLTSIAYETGYFDQSHFIREFKSFTGTTPSAFNSVSSSTMLTQ